MEQTNPSQEAQKLADDLANCIECIEQNSIVGGPIKDTIWFSDAGTLVDELHRIMERLRTQPVNQQLTAQAVSGGERERFEAWMIDRGFEPFDLRRGHSGDYIDLETDGRWQAWQAASPTRAGATHG